MSQSNRKTSRSEPIRMPLPDGRFLEVNEHWFMEWFEFGFVELETMMGKQARFDDWRRENDR